MREGGRVGLMGGFEGGREGCVFGKEWGRKGGSVVFM